MSTHIPIDTFEDARINTSCPIQVSLPIYSLPVPKKDAEEQILTPDSIFAPHILRSERFRPKHLVSGSMLDINL